MFILYLCRNYVDSFNRHQIFPLGLFDGLALTQPILRLILSEHQGLSENVFNIDTSYINFS